MQIEGQPLPESVVPECLVADTFGSLEAFKRLEHQKVTGTGESQSDDDDGEGVVEEGQGELTNDKGTGNQPGGKIKELIEGAKDLLKDGPKAADSNLQYVIASWLTKEGILSGTTITMKVADDATYESWSWG